MTEFRAEQREFIGLHRTVLLTQSIKHCLDIEFRSRKNMAVSIARKGVLTSVTKKAIWPDGKFPNGLPSKWKPIGHDVVSWLPWRVLQEAAGAVGAELPNMAKANADVVRKVIAACGRTAKKFELDDARRQQFESVVAILSHQMWIGVEQIDWQGLREDAKVVGTELPEIQNRTSEELRVLAATFDRIAKKFQPKWEDASRKAKKTAGGKTTAGATKKTTRKLWRTESGEKWRVSDVREGWFTEAANLLRQMAMFRAQEENGINLLSVMPSPFDSVDALRGKAALLRKQALRVNDKPLEEVLSQRADEAERRARDVESVGREVSKGKTKLAHSQDYRSVSWEQDNFVFTKNQAQCIRVMWEAHQQGLVELAQDEILKAANVLAVRLVDVFKRHKNWRRFIVNGSKKGLFRLAPLTQNTTQIAIEKTTTH